MRASRAITLLGTAFSSRIYMMTFKYHPRQQNSRRIYTSMRIENQNSISSIHRKSKFDQLYASKIKIRSALCIANQNSISSIAGSSVGEGDIYKNAILSNK